MSIIYFVCAAILSTLVLSRVNARFLSREDLEANADIADKYLMILTAVYGIFLAFVITNLWSGNDKAVDLSHAEASEIVYTTLLSDSLPVAQGDLLRVRLIKYTQSVVDGEWPTMRERHGSRLIYDHGTYEELWMSAFSLPSDEPRAADLRNRILDAVHEIGDQRRTRLLMSEDRLSTFFKVTVILGAIATILPLTFIGGRKQLFQIVCSCCAVGLLTIMVCLVFDLNSQYAGVSQISSQPFQNVLDRMDRKVK